MGPDIQSRFPTLFHDESEPLNTYLIVDCAQFDHKFYRNMRKDASLAYRSLFTNTVHESAAFAGPVLVQIDSEKNSAFLETITAIEKEGIPAVTWLWNPSPFEEVFNRLQPLLFARLENGKAVLSRYYDPRCIAAFLSYFMTEPKLLTNVGNIPVWAIWQKSGRYQYIETSTG